MILSAKIVPGTVIMADGSYATEEEEAELQAMWNNRITINKMKSYADMVKEELLDIAKRN